VLQELSHMDRITQLQGEIQQLSPSWPARSPTVYLTSRANFVQASADVPITKQRNPHKFDSPEVFEGTDAYAYVGISTADCEYLIKSLPEGEPEEEQAKCLRTLDKEMAFVNDEYIQAVARSKHLHEQIMDVLRLMFED
ncbi:hypothetical protein B0H17DRAFT_950537, partial [Mycena rosella]